MDCADRDCQLFTNWMTGNVDDIEFSHQSLREDEDLLAGSGAVAISRFGFFCVPGTSVKEWFPDTLEIFSAGLCEADRIGVCGLFQSACEGEGFKHSFVDFCSFQKVDSTVRRVLTKGRNPSIHRAEESWSV